MSYLPWGTYDEVPFSDLVGKRITAVDKTSDEIHFYTECGLHYKMYHSQDCCEHVYVDAIDGNLDLLVGGEVYAAYDSSDSGPSGEYGDSVTWTFYRIRTEREFVHITWRGSSNGYYSERVSFIRFKEPQE